MTETTSKRTRAPWDWNHATDEERRAFGEEIIRRLGVAEKALVRIRDRRWWWFWEPSVQSLATAGLKSLRSDK